MPTDKNKPKPIRHLTIGDHMVCGRYYYSAYTSVPQIRLSGKWLKAFGFKPGKRVTVQCHANQLIISLGARRLKYNTPKVKGRANIT